MRVVTFSGSAVKKQHKLKSGDIRVVFYDKPPTVVSLSEWQTNSKSEFYSDDVRRSEIVRKK